MRIFTAIRNGLATKEPYLLGSLAIFALDQWTKWLVEVHLPLYSSRSVLPGFLDLIHVKNTGVAFGLFASDGAWGPRILAGIGALALALILVYFSRAASGQRLLLFALALVLGGAAGNLVDRVVRGSVTDFVDVYVGTHHWPAFNVADSAISVALVLLLFDAFRPRKDAMAPQPSGVES